MVRKFSCHSFNFCVPYLWVTRRGVVRYTETCSINWNYTRYKMRHFTFIKVIIMDDTLWLLLAYLIIYIYSRFFLLIVQHSWVTYFEIIIIIIVILTIHYTLFGPLKDFTLNHLLWGESGNWHIGEIIYLHESWMSIPLQYLIPMDV